MSQIVQAPLTLEQVSKLFSNWRETRPVKGPIPENLLKAVASLQVSYSSRTIAKALRLNQTDMKSRLKRLEAEPNHRAESASLEIQKPVVNSHGSIQVTKIVAVESIKTNACSSVEIVSPDGWVLRTSSGTIQKPQILEFARAVSEVAQ